MGTQVGLPCAYPLLCQLLTWGFGLGGAALVMYLIKLGWDEWKKVNGSADKKS